jgi:hypothetical protein
VQSTFAALLEFEVFHCVSHVNFGPLDARRLQRFVQQLTSGSHEWMSLPVFFVAWLFSHQSDPRRPGAFAKHSLGRVTVKITSAAALYLIPKGAQRGVLGDERGCGRRFFCHHNIRRNLATESIVPSA